MCGRMGMGIMAIVGVGIVIIMAVGIVGLRGFFGEAESCQSADAGRQQKEGDDECGQAPGPGGIGGERGMRLRIGRGIVRRFGSNGLVRIMAWRHRSLVIRGEAGSGKERDDEKGNCWPHVQGFTARRRRSKGGAGKCVEPETCCAE